MQIKVSSPGLRQMIVDTITGEVWIEKVRHMTGRRWLARVTNEAQIATAQSTARLLLKQAQTKE